MKSKSFFFGWNLKEKLELKPARRIKFSARPDTEHWGESYSLAEYAEAFERAVKKLASAKVRYFQDKEFISNGFGIECQIKSGDRIIGEEINRCLRILKGVCEECEKQLAATARKNSVTTFFSFPLGVKSACEQY